jgi:hypothetical protein
MQYVIELYKPAYSGNHFTPDIKGRVHKGTFEENRDSLSPCMVQVKEIVASNMTCAKARMREQLGDYRLYRARSAKY